MRLVLDTSAFLSGLPVPTDATLVVPPGVREEIEERGASGRAFAYLREKGLETRAPSPEALARVDDAARRSGDHARMSRTDLEVVALALDLACPLLSDDYRVQNVARVLGVEARGVAERGIREEWRWVWRCRGCGRFLPEPPSRNECSICGAEGRLVRDARDRSKDSGRSPRKG